MLIYITGPTGSGKSTIKDLLARQDHIAYDADDAGMRQWQLGEGAPNAILTVPVSTIKQRKAQALRRPVFLCGTLPNDQDYIEYFDKIILLSIDAKTQEQRIKSRSNNNYGKTPKQLENALKWREPQIKKYKSMNAITIDATRSIKHILHKTLSEIA